MMKRTIWLLVIWVVKITGGYAQTTSNSFPRLSAGFIYGAATGPAADNYTYASGFSLKYQLPVKSSRVNITFTTGYDFSIPQTRFVAYINPLNGGGPRVNYAQAAFIPLEAGARFYFVKGFYFEGDVGASINVNSHHEYYTKNTVAAIVSPGLGYAFRFGSGNKYGLDLDLGYNDRFESSDNHQYYQGGYGRVGLGAAFSFGL